MRQFVISTALVLSSALLSGCEQASESNTFIDRGLFSSQFDTRPIPLKIGDTYLAIPRNYIDSFDRTGKDGPFIKTGGVLLFAHWPTMAGRTQQNRNEIYSAESKNGYHTVDMHIVQLGSVVYPNDDDQFARGYQTKIFGFGDEQKSLGHVSRDGNLYGFERYIRKNNSRFSFYHGPTALILRKLDKRGKIASYVYCDSHEIKKSQNKKINYDDKNERFIQQSVCNLYVHYDGFEIKSSFVEGNRLTEVAELEAAIRSKMDEFIAAGEAIRS